MTPSTPRARSGSFVAMPGSIVLAPSADPRVFLAPDGSKHSPPPGWACLPPGDAGLTRRVKAAGPSWSVIEKRGRKAFSKGLWAPRENIEAARAALDAERSTESYAKKRATDLARRERTHHEYVAEFEAEVLAFLRFSREWALLGETLARRVAAHATPVGSGTVARTKRIGVDERAAAAVIAWMRHQTTAYDDMKIARIKGERREVRRALAQISRGVLDRHRQDVPHGIASCPLCKAIVGAAAEPARPAPPEPSRGKALS
ncbi:MAG: hypothetical protein JWP97_4512 [Labilithrix sp.]|nr:hypothetical protein [Labilithrix sp.]